MAGTTRKPMAYTHPDRAVVETPSKVGAGAPAGSSDQIGHITNDLLERARQEILAVTYWFEPAPSKEPYPVTVRFSGHRVGAKGKPRNGESFIQDENVARVIPGSGPISVTAKIRDVQPGEWDVTARILEPTQATRSSRNPNRVQSQVRIPTGSALTLESPDRLDTWVWRRWAPSVDWANPVRTSLEPFVHVPGAFPLVWAVMVGLGMVVALVVQTLLLAHDHYRLGPIWAWTLLAIAVGVAGAKVWFIVKHRSEHRFEGWCIQGFIAGAAPAGLILFTLAHAPTLTVLDATAPGLMFGMAVGRIGCFLGGCCEGRPTDAPWGVWSSDQRIGVRRIPTQLMESASALILGLVLLAVFLIHGPAHGAIFVAALAAYTLLREGLLRLRAEALKTRGPAVSIAAGAVLLAALVVVAL
ncbi:MAG: prolipoprotein diacylglyceryl transferase [Ktedonobacterales bacterium]